MNEKIKKVIFSIDICQFLGYMDYTDLEYSQPTRGIL